MTQYTVKEVARLVGVPAPTLRAWERRYQVVVPPRTPGQYRMYSASDVERLRKMAALIAEGTPARNAASQVRGDMTAPTHTTRAPSTEQLVEAAQRLDSATLDQLLSAAFASGPFEQIWDDVLVPALRTVGTCWRTGTISVASEHLFAEAVGRRISRLYEAAEPDRDGPPVLVGLPVGARHQLGALAFATCCRRLGMQVRYLGSDLPQAGWLEAADATSWPCVVSVPTPSDAVAALPLVIALSRITRVFVGGAGAERLGHLEGVTLLTGRMSETAAQVAGAVVASSR